MKKTAFPTPQDAEAAFYDALERGDLEAMMEVWADDEEIVCVHPGGPRIAGFEQVRESWARILASGQRLKVRLSDPVYVQGMMISVHSVHEHIAAGADPRQHPVVTTNVYLRQAGGWRMIAHHASPAPQPPRAAAEPPKILH
jgi:ketosteroid isomerase-like protein